MHEQGKEGAGLMTLEAEQSLGWQAAAIAEYEQSWLIRHADLQTDLSTRILALTGQRISPLEIYTDGRLAVAGVNGVTFRLHHGDLVLMRPCTYCGTGSFESPVGLAAAPIQNIAMQAAASSSLLNTFRQSLPDFAPPPPTSPPAWSRAPSPACRPGRWRASSPRAARRRCSR